MIATLTFAALVGRWICSSPDEPRNRFLYTFASNGRGSLAYASSSGVAEKPIERFTYRVANGYVLKDSPGKYPVRDRIVIRGSTLEDRGYDYRRDGMWVPPPDQNTYVCRRP